MKLFNSNIDKARLRRNEINRNSAKSINMRKSYLSKRIIKERANIITANNIEREYNQLACVIKTDEILTQIMYHIKFARDTRPSTFNDDVIIGILDRVKDLQNKFLAGDITAEEHLKWLEDMDSQIIDKINNMSQYK